jgi:hypothetical protein
MFLGFVPVFPDCDNFLSKVTQSIRYLHFISIVSFLNQIFIIVGLNERPRRLDLCNSTGTTWVAISIIEIFLLVLRFNQLFTTSQMLGDKISRYSVVFPLRS